MTNNCSVESFVLMISRLEIKGFKYFAHRNESYNEKKQ